MPSPMSPQTIVENESYPGCRVCGGRTAESINGRKERKVEWGDILLIECLDTHVAACIAYANSGLHRTADKRQWKKRKSVWTWSSPMSPPGLHMQIPGIKLWTGVNGRKGSGGYQEIAGALTGPDLAKAASSPGLSTLGSVCGNTDNGGEKPTLSVIRAAAICGRTTVGYGSKPAKIMANATLMVIVKLPCHCSSTWSTNGEKVRGGLMEHRGKACTAQYELVDTQEIIPHTNRAKSLVLGCFE
ncbi:hypothetical protein EDB86DRAFT_2840981 [Lactarius hatsudake]|nr:hypothetical protein EDB86DRAFT_2840981 [Lactarius hatsudake]